jgi:hypothetical protein
MSVENGGEDQTLPHLRTRRTILLSGRRIQRQQVMERASDRRRSNLELHHLHGSGKESPIR